MNDLHILVANDNIIRTTLADLPKITGAEYWLLASPRYVDALPAGYREVYSRILVQPDFDDAALIDRMETELRDRRVDVRFLTSDEGCELICATLQSRFGKPVWSVDRVVPFVNKMVCKERLAGAGLRLPRHVRFERERLADDPRGYCASIAEQLGFPMIAKPVDRSASIDVSRLDSLAGLRSWAAWASSPKDQNTYEIDEFIDGALYNCDSLVQDGRVIWSNVCLNVNPCLDYASGRSIGAYTIPAEDPVAHQIREANARILTVLEPPDGAIHLEIFRNRYDELIFLEVAARPPGGDIRRIYLRTFGFDIDIAHFLLRAQWPYRHAVTATGLFGGWFIHPRSAGVVTRIDRPPLLSETDLRVYVEIGDTIGKPSRNIVDPPSMEAVLFNHDFAQFDQDVDVLRELTLYQVEA